MQQKANGHHLIRKKGNGDGFMRTKAQFTRRDLLRGAMLGVARLPVFPLVGWAEKQRGFTEPAAVPYPGSDDALLDEIERTAFDFFWNEAGTSGQVKDRAQAQGKDTHTIASIAATRAMTAKARGAPSDHRARTSPIAMTAAAASAARTIA